MLMRETEAESSVPEHSEYLFFSGGRMPGKGYVHSLRQYCMVDT